MFIHRTAVRPVLAEILYGMRMLRRSMIAVLVALALVCGLVQAAGAAAAGGRRAAGLPGPVATDPLPPGQLSGQAKAGPENRRTQEIEPESGPLHEQAERIRAALAERQAPPPAVPEPPSSDDAAATGGVVGQPQKAEPAAPAGERPDTTGTAAATAASAAGTARGTVADAVHRTTSSGKGAAPAEGDSAGVPGAVVRAAVTYGATYDPAPSFVENPRYDNPGRQTVRVTNTGNTAWAAGTVSLGYHLRWSDGSIYNDNGTGTVINATVPPGYYVDVNAIFQTLPAGSFVLNWDLRTLNGGGSGFWSRQGVPASRAVGINVPHYAPTGYVYGPEYNATVDSLSPNLIFDVGADRTQNNYTEFQVCPDTTLSGCWSSGQNPLTMNGFFAAAVLQPPAGVLSWNRTYYWRARVTDASYPNTPWSSLSPFTTVVTAAPGAHLGPGEADPAGVDLYQGNFSHTDTDFTLPVDGATVTVARTYNSASTTPGVFGPGWSSLLDVRQDVSADGFLTVTYSNGRRIRYGRNPDGTWVPAYGQSDEARYARPGAVGLADGTVYMFNPDGTLHSITGPGGQVSYLNYSAGRLSRIDLGVSRALYATWDGNGRLTALSTNGGTPQRLPGVQTWTYGYDGQGGLASACNPRWDVSACTAYAYDGPGRRLSTITPPNGTAETVTLGYDSVDGRVTTVALPNASGPGGDNWLYAKYDPVQTNAAFTVLVTTPTGLTTNYQFGRRGELWNRWTGTPTPQNTNTRTWTYDRAGRVESLTDENGNITEYYHDGWGNLHTVNQSRDGQTAVSTSYHYFTGAGTTYDLDDPRTGKIVEIVDPNFHRTTMAYNSHGDLTAVTAPPTAAAPGGARTTYEYTCDTGAGWNSGAAPVTVNDPAGGGGRQPCGLLAATTDPDGRTTRYAYDSFGEQTRITTPAGETTNLFHDGLGHLTRKTVTQPDGSPAAETTYVYDGAGHLVTQTDPAVRNEITGVVHQRRTVNTYDANGNLKSATVSDTTPSANGGDAPRTTAYDYDTRGRQTAVRVNGTGTGTKAYDGLGNVVRSTDGNGNVHTYTYHPRTGWLLGIAMPAFADDPASPGTTRQVQLVAYTYDNAGRIATSQDAMAARVAYTYSPDNLKLTETFTDYRDTPTSPSRDLVLHSYTYDLAGNVLTDLAGGSRTTTSTYDADNALLSSTLDPAGLKRTTTRTYDPAGLPLTTTLSDGVRTETSADQYDPVGRQVRRTVHNDATADLVTAYTRDARGQPLTVTDPRGMPTAGATPDPAFTTTRRYDALGRLAATTGPQVKAEDGTGAAPTTVAPTEARGYDTFGELTDVRDARGQVTRTVFDNRGRRVEVVHPTSTEPNGTVATPREKWAYDNNDNVVARTDLLGQTTDITYDGRNRPVRATTPAATPGGTRGVTRYAWNDGGKLLSEIGPTGAQTLRTYDGMGRVSTLVTVERYVQGPGGAQQFTTAYRYNPFGDLLTETSNGTGVIRNYNAAGEMVNRTVTGRATTAYHYDVAGRVDRVTDELGRRTDVTYDLAGREIRRTVADDNGVTLSTTAWTNDRAGLRTAVTDPNGNTWQTTYDALGRAEKLTDPVPTDADGTTLAAPVTSFGYDAAGNRTRLTDGNGNATYTTYNAWNLPSVRTAPATTAHPAVADRTWRTSYNASGAPVATTAPGGVATASAYDLLGRLTATTGSGAEATTQGRHFGYDLAGRLTSIDAIYGTENFAYNDRGLLLGYSHPSFAGDGDAVYVNQYDALGRLTVRSGVAGTTAFGYDNAGAVTTATDSLTGTTRGYTYDQAGRMTGQTDTTAAGAVATRYSFGYDGLDRPLTESAFDPAGNQTGRISYGWDANGNLTSTSGSGKLVGQSDRTYRYDAANRLISTTEQGTRTDYGWDAAGNRTSATVSTLVGGVRTGSVTTTAQYDQRNRLIRTDSQQTAASYQWQPRGTLAAVTTEALPEGDPVTVRTKSDAFDQLVDDGGTANTYDALGRIVLSNGRNVEYDGLGAEPVSDGQWLYARDLAERPTGAKSLAGQTSSLLTNVHGDVIGAADPGNGASRGTRSYGPFGEPRAGTAGLSPLGFQGGWTAASGKVGARSRWYDPTTGGFTAQDSAPGPVSDAASANLYGYGAANPTSRVDPDGHFGVSVLSTFEGIIAGLGDVAAAGAEIIAGASPEIAEAIGAGLLEAGIEAGAVAACVIGCLEALVVGAVVVVVVAGVYFAMQVSADGSLNPTSTVSPGAAPIEVDPVTSGPVSIDAPVTTPVRVPGPEAGPPLPPPTPPTPPTVRQPVATSTTSTNSWAETSSWYDDTYLYNRTDNYVRTTTRYYLDGVQTGEPSVRTDHSWVLTWQLLIDTSNPVVIETPVPGEAQKPVDGQGTARPDGTCGNGGAPTACAGEESAPKPGDAGKGGKGRNPRGGDTCMPEPDDAGDWVDPNLINFSQRTVTASDYLAKMLKGLWDWNRPGTALRVIDRGGQLVSYDNRRLKAARQMRALDPDYRVKVERVDPNAPNPEKSKGLSWDKSFRQRQGKKRNWDENGCGVPLQGLFDLPVDE
ncbi:RHS repeat-associated core domain-containing protein [Kitasatospora purpeofusca]|uniref:RHS repeat-associated core domain-containing protein n=1 Tax=Kitasatospora purpeofusca TaxID=67352 RepID=UPI0030F0F80D